MVAAVSMTAQAANETLTLACKGMETRRRDNGVREDVPPAAHSHHPRALDVLLLTRQPQVVPRQVLGLALAGSARQVIFSSLASRAPTVVNFFDRPPGPH
jgi:hypothetical protein